MLAAGHMDGSITIPGHPVGGQECPADLLEKEPELPKLNIMVARSDFYPEVPGATVRQWTNHEFGKEFQRFLDNIHEEYGPMPEAPAAANAADKEKEKENKTGGNGQEEPNPGPSSRKRRQNQQTGSVKASKVERTKVVPTTEP